MKLINKILLAFSFLAIESKSANKNINKNKTNVKIEAFETNGPTGILIIKVNNEIKRITLTVCILSDFYQEVEKQYSPDIAFTIIEKMTIPYLEEYFKDDTEKKIKELDNQVLLIHGDNDNKIKALFINAVKVNHHKIITLMKTLNVEEKIINKIQDMFKNYKYYSDDKSFILRHSTPRRIFLLTPDSHGSIVSFVNKKADELQMTKEEKVLAVSILQMYYYNTLSDIIDM